MREWEVKIYGAKDSSRVEEKTWIERVKAIDQVAARSEAMTQARQKKPCYAIYDISTIIEVKA